MKKEFEMPEIKVSKFNVENIVTDSAAIAAAQAVLESKGISAEHTTTVTFDQLFEFNTGN